MTRMIKATDAGQAQPLVLTFEKRAASANSYVGTVGGGGTVDVLVLYRRNTATAQHFRALFRVDKGRPVVRRSSRGNL
jgi:hypothetical protein